MPLLYSKLTLSFCLLLLTMSHQTTQNPFKNFLSTNPTSSELEWWKTAVVYQIYPKSFKDTNGNGIGDLKGITQKLDYLNDGTEKSLGVDALWLNPIFPSPQIDSGYDISDYTGIDPQLGTLADFKELVKEAHKRKMKIILDFVGNHCSDEHPWFQESKSGRNSPKRDWFYWKDPKPDGSLPNNWQSCFGGPAWEWDPKTEQFYLHQFTKKQVDINWRNPEVKRAMIDVLRFWLELGVDGFRMDVIWMIMKNKDMKDQPWIPGYDPLNPTYDDQKHIYDSNDPEIHPLLRDIRAAVNEYGCKVLIGEVTTDLPLDVWIKYYGEHDDEIQMPFNFRLKDTGWNAEDWRNHVELLEKTIKGIGWPNYVLGSHDAQRIASLHGLAQARNAGMLLLTLKGTPTLYNGDELGKLDTILKFEDWKDPQAIATHAKWSRDFVRTPFQWDSTPNAGFTFEGVKTWLPIAEDYKIVNKQNLEKNSKSILHFYRKMLWLRKRTPALNRGDYETLWTSQPKVFAFKRSFEGNVFTVVINPTEEDFEVRFHELDAEIILSTELDREGKVENYLILRRNEGIIMKNE